MMNYSSYQFYEQNYQGDLSMPLFNSLIPKASREIDRACNRVLEEADITDEVKFVACELVDYLRGIKQSNLASVSIDGVSKTYNNKTKREIRRDIEAITDGLPLDLIRLD